MKPNVSRVLFIDENKPANFFTRLMQEDRGCINHMKIMQSGEEAPGYSFKNEAGNNTGFYPDPALIFPDINLPAPDGWQFLEEYKEPHVVNRIIAVMLTTSLFPGDKSGTGKMPEIPRFENSLPETGKVAAVLNKYFANVTTK